MPNPQNIQPHKFKKGQSGNPKGRPRKLPELKSLLDEVMGEEGGGMSAMEAMLKRIRKKAIDGDLRAAELLLKYSYGMPKQSVELSDPAGNNPFTGIEVIIKKPE